MSRVALLLFVLVVTGSVPARADLALEQAAGRYVIEPGRSRIGFTVSQAGGGGIHGLFKAFGGSFVIDGRDVTRSSVELTVDPSSVDTGAERVDAFIRGKAVFDAERKPPVTFHTTKVTRTGDETAHIEGVLKVRGIDKPADFDIRLMDRKGNRITFRVTGAIRRAPYDMQVGFPIYSNNVDFDMVFSGRKR